MVLRTADALGLDGVIYSASCDIYSPKVVRATMGSLFRMQICCTAEIAPVLDACRSAGVESCAAVVKQMAELVGSCAFPAERQSSSAMRETVCRRRSPQPVTAV